MIITLNIALRLVLLQWTFIYVKKCYCFLLLFQSAYSKLIQYQLVSFVIVLLS